MVRSHLDYCCSVWALYRKGDIEALKRYRKGQQRLFVALFVEEFASIETGTFHIVKD